MDFIPTWYAYVSCYPLHDSIEHSTYMDVKVTIWTKHNTNVLAYTQFSGTLAFG